MLEAVRKADGRVAVRDYLLILLAYRHGSGASELTALSWDHVALSAGRLAVTRLKNGETTRYPLRRTELRALRAWKREQGGAGAYVFTSLRGAPMTRRTVHYAVAEAGGLAGVGFPVIGTCCATAPRTTSPTKDPILELFSSISGTKTFSTQCVIRALSRSLYEFLEGLRREEASRLRRFK